MVDHLGLVERDPTFARAINPIGTAAAEALHLELSRIAKQPAVVGHVKHGKKFDPPRVSRLPFGVLDQDRDAAVDALLQFRVGERAEHRTSARVRV